VCGAFVRFACAIKVIELAQYQSSNPHPTYSIIMRASLSTASVLLSVLLRFAFVDGQTKIVLTNDDGWAVANIRAQNSALIAAGFNVVLSAPAENESGTGSSDSSPTTVGSSGCEFDSCAPGSAPTGNNASNSK